MDTKKYLIISGTFFGVVALLHLARILLGWHFQIGTWLVPYWMSWCAVIATGGLSAWGFRQATR